MGVLDGTKANSAPNLVGVGAGAELGKNTFSDDFSTFDLALARAPITDRVKLANH